MAQHWTTDRPRRGRGGAGKITRPSDGQNRREPVWVCQACDTWYTEDLTGGGRPRSCNMRGHGCGGQEFHYFPSKKEARRYAQLRLLERQGIISELELQPKYPITALDTRACAFKAFEYRADFRYMRDGVRVVEDVKAWETPIFNLKKRIVERAYHITIKLVTRA